MKVTVVSIGVGRTVNLGNFESLRVDVSMTAEIEQGRADGTAAFDAEVQELRYEVLAALYETEEQARAEKQQAHRPLPPGVIETPPLPEGPVG